MKIALIVLAVLLILTCGVVTVIYSVGGGYYHPNPVRTVTVKPSKKTVKRVTVKPRPTMRVRRGN